LLSFLWLRAASVCPNRAASLSSSSICVATNLNEEKTTVNIPPESCQQDAQKYAGLQEQQTVEVKRLMHAHLPSGRQRGFPFVIAADWSAEEALAAYEMLDDLRAVIWAHYQIPIQALLQQDRCPVSDADSSVSRIDDPF
jgi:hypothetical protein